MDDTCRFAEPGQEGAGRDAKEGAAGPQDGPAPRPAGDAVKSPRRAA